MIGPRPRHNFATRRKAKDKEGHNYANVVDGRKKRNAIDDRKNFAKSTTLLVGVIGVSGVIGVEMFN